MKPAYVKLSVRSSFLLVLVPLVICALGMVIILIGLSEGLKTVLIGVAFSSIAAPALFHWIPGFREVRVGEDGVILRFWWRDRMIPWLEIKKAIVVSGMILAHFVRPGGVELILKKRGYFGVPKSILIPDIFNVKKRDLADLIDRYASDYFVSDK